MRPLLSFNDIATFCRVSTRTVRRYVDRGLLKPIRISSRTVRFSEADVLALTQQTVLKSSGVNAPVALPEQQESNTACKCERDLGSDSPSVPKSDKRSR